MASGCAFFYLYYQVQYILIAGIFSTQEMVNSCTHTHVDFLMSFVFKTDKHNNTVCYTTPRKSIQH